VPAVEIVGTVNTMTTVAMECCAKIADSQVRSSEATGLEVSGKVRDEDGRGRARTETARMEAARMTAGKNRKASRMAAARWQDGEM